MTQVKLPIVLNKSAEGIAQEVQRLVISGALAAGARLPPVRVLADEIGVSPATVSQAWKLLGEHGVIETRGRLGTFVADPERREPWRRFRRVAGVDLPHDLSTGFPDPDLLIDLAPYLQEASRIRYFRGYDAGTITPALREALRDEVPGDISGDNVVLATHVLGLLTEVLPVVGGFRTGVIVGDPEFAPYLDLLERAGMTARPVEHDEEGLRLDEVRAEVDGGAAAVILQPRVHNPTGVPMSEERLREIALLCAEGDVAIIESDYFGALSSSVRMTAGRWAPDQTLNIRSFSKDLHPDLRVVVASGSPRITQSVLRRRVGGFDVSGINQELLRLMLTSSDARRGTGLAKLEYDRRRSILVHELARADIHVGSKDGFNVWVPVRSEQDALIHLAYNGISAAPGSAFQVRRRDPHVRVSIAGMGGATADIAARIAAAARAHRVKG